MSFFKLACLSCKGVPGCFVNFHRFWEMSQDYVLVARMPRHGRPWLQWALPSVSSVGPLIRNLTNAWTWPGKALHPLEGLWDEHCSSTLALRWPGDSQREWGRFARIDSRESIRRKTPAFITFERFARIASNMRFASFSAPEMRFAKRNSVREPWDDSRESPAPYLPIVCVTSARLACCLSNVCPTLVCFHWIPNVSD